MDICKARRIASRQRQNIGRLLASLKKMKVSFQDEILVMHGHVIRPQSVEPSMSKWNETVELLRANMKDLRRLYAQYPQIKPIRSKQLNLFKGN